MKKRFVEPLLRLEGGLGMTQQPPCTSNCFD